MNIASWKNLRKHKKEKLCSISYSIPFYIFQVHLYTFPSKFSVESFQKWSVFPIVLDLSKISRMEIGLKKISKHETLSRTTVGITFRVLARSEAMCQHSRTCANTRLFATRDASIEQRVMYFACSLSILSTLCQSHFLKTFLTSKSRS